MILDRRLPSPVTLDPRSSRWLEVAALHYRSFVHPRGRVGREAPVGCAAAGAIIRRGWGFFRPDRLHQEANGCSRRSFRWWAVADKPPAAGHPPASSASHEQTFAGRGTDEVAETLAAVSRAAMAVDVAGPRLAEEQDGLP
jgi:hypothetical protein